VYRGRSRKLLAIVARQVVDRHHRGLNMGKKQGKSTHDKKAIEKQISPIFESGLGIHEAAKAAGIYRYHVEMTAVQLAGTRTEPAMLSKLQCRARADHRRRWTTMASFNAEWTPAELPCRLSTAVECS